MVNKGELGTYLSAIRKELDLSLREVEKRTNKVVSNAYLSQLENNKATNPSPNILFALADVYEIPYEDLMIRAGYMANPEEREIVVAPASLELNPFGDITPEETAELLKYLEFLRSKK